MSLLYKITQRINPQNRTAPPKFYLTSKSRGYIDFEVLLDAACEGTTADRDEVRLAVKRLFKKSEDYLDLGFNVHLGDLGYLELSIRSKGAKNEKEATPALAQDIVPHFIFSEKIRSRLKKTKLEKVSE